MMMIGFYCGWSVGILTVVGMGEGVLRVALLLGSTYIRFRGSADTLAP